MEKDSEKFPLPHPKKKLALPRRPSVGPMCVTSPARKEHGRVFRVSFITLRDALLYLGARKAEDLCRISVESFFFLLHCAEKVTKRFRAHPLHRLLLNSVWGFQ
ncbi:hypothetical protein CDAR_253801 [Caerostris darwini]|uniref:Uncharacterized protein n=1 Tax=Caerostris darwini TaxID=1538125 RepID=A0AAV4Q7T2_9ARAC|nr:hypothetical protein CDAR_253801 [Caerostris darwini]